MAAPTAAESYNWWAEAYDECNSENDYEQWLGEVLLPELETLGLKQGWALDIGCGTGFAFPPLLKRNWKVIGCDASGGMLDAAKRKFGAAAPLFELDARDLPSISPETDRPAKYAFNLVLMLNDVINYLLDDTDLDRVLSGIERNLSREGGLGVFDANTVALFHRDYDAGVSEKLGSEGWSWQGLTQQSGSEQIYQARLCSPSGQSHLHRQRHWSPRQIQAAITASGLRCVAVRGQRESRGGIHLSPSPSEDLDLKTLYFVSHLRPS